MAKGGIDWYDGATEPSAGESSAIPPEPKMSAGGPIETFDGGEEGHSFGVPDKPANAVSEPSRGSGSVISGPVSD